MAPGRRFAVAALLAVTSVFIVVGSTSAAAAAPTPVPSPTITLDPATAPPGTNAPLPLTGEPSRDDLRLASLLLVAGGASVLAAGELRWRTHRRSLRRSSA